MKRLPLYILLFAVLSIAGCVDDSNDLVSPDATLFEEQQLAIEQYLEERDITTQQNAAGIHYRALTENPDGALLDSGDIVNLYYRIEELTGGIIAVRDSASADAPLTYTFGNGSMLAPRGLDELVNLMQTGETYEFYLPSNWAYLDYRAPNLIASNAIVKARVQLTEVLTSEEQMAREDHRIRAYLEDQPFNSVDSLDSGVYYASTQPGDTTVPIMSNSVVKVRYTGTFLDGTEFDSNVGGDLLEFTISEGELIDGFLIGAAQMSLGEKGVILIPSHLAYGQSVTAIPHRIVGDWLGINASPVPPYSPLRFDIEVIEVN